MAKATRKHCKSCGGSSRYTKQPCEECLGEGSLPFAPALGDIVICRPKVLVPGMIGVSLRWPLLVMDSSRIMDDPKPLKKLPYVIVSGWLFDQRGEGYHGQRARPSWVQDIPGPYDEPGCWDWKGDRW